MLPIRVLDLTDERGQLCGQILADLGADVILIEPPGGAHSRSLGPFAGDRVDLEGSLVHWSQNRGKRSAVFDLERRLDRGLLLDLVRTVDVVVESFDPGYLEGLELGRSVIEAAAPAVVHISITAFGSDGPKANWAYSDLTIAAAAGPMSLTGDEDRPPLRVSLPQAFLHAAADAAGAALIALYDRDHHSGRGQHVDISAQQSYSVASQSYLLSDPVRAPSASRSAGGVRPGTIDAKIQMLWPCKDGQVSVTFLFGSSIGPFTRRLMEWVHEEGFCDRATLDKDWIEYGNLLSRGDEPVSEYERIKQILADFFATRTKAELFDATFARRVLIAPVTTTEELVAAEQFAARDFWEQVDCGPHGTVRFPGPFAKFSATPLPPLPAPATLGADTEAVMAEAAAAGEVERNRVQGSPGSTGGIAAAAAGAASVSGTAPDPTERRRPLDGLKIADFMWVFAGPWATRTLADLGATVVRVESTTRLDTLRTAGQFQDGNVDPDWAIQFANLNPGKRSIALDLTKPEGREVAVDLVRWADVTTESFTPKAMAGFGLDYDTLAQLRPDLIMASSCLMGHTGPQSSLAGFGTMAAAVSGWFHITGWPDRQPCGPFGAYTDYVAPRFLVVAILAALEHRRRTGVGQYIDLSQAEASMRLLGPAVLDYTVNGRVMERLGNDDPVHAPHGVYRARGDDAWVAVTVTSQAQWQALCRLVDRPDLAGLDCGARHRSGRELGELVQCWTATRSPEQAMKLLQEAGVAAHQVQNSTEAFHDPQLIHRGHFVEVPHSAMGRSWVEGSRLRFSRTPARIETGSPTVGEHSWEVLTEVLGYPDDRAAALAVTGAVG